MSLYYVTANPDFPCTEWWERAVNDVAEGVAPKNVRRAFARLMGAQRASGPQGGGAVMTPEEYAAVLEWAASIPGYDRGPITAPHPLLACPMGSEERCNLEPHKRFRDRKETP